MLITRGGVYQSHYFVKYKALFMTRMTGMTRNMKTTSDTGTANKVSKVEMVVKNLSPITGGVIRLK